MWPAAPAVDEEPNEIASPSGTVEAPFERNWVFQRAAKPLRLNGGWQIDEEPILELYVLDHGAKQAEYLTNV